MSGSPGWGMQQAIYGRLSGDATLVTTLGAAIYDHAPDGADYPYIVIGEVTEATNETMGRTGVDSTVTIHAWSRYQGGKQVKQIHNRIAELLDRWLPTIAGWNVTDFQPEFFEAFRDPDGITRHGVSRFRIHTHQ